MKLLCCDGPLNGRYYELVGLWESQGHIQEGDLFALADHPDAPIYEVQRWPNVFPTVKGELVLIWADAKPEIEQFASAPYDWAVEADFDFPLSTLIKDAVADAEVR